MVLIVLVNSVYIYIIYLFFCVGLVYIVCILRSLFVLKVSLAVVLRCFMMLIVSVFCKIFFSCNLRIVSAKRNKILGFFSKK